METKQCTTCLVDKPLTDYHKLSKAKDGRQNRCKDCDKKYHHLRYLKDKEKINRQAKEWRENNKELAETAGKEWRKSNPDKVKKYQRVSNLRKSFGIEIEEYAALLDSQKGVCALCEQPETFIHFKTGEPARLAVDHCHASGKVRKLLCKNCNTGLGLFKDNTELLIKAAAYLKEHRG